MNANTFLMGKSNMYSANLTKIYLAVCFVLCVIGGPYAQPTVQWTKEISVGYYTKLYAARTTISGGYILCGSTSEEVTTLYDDALLVNMDTAANVSWSKRIGDADKSEYAYGAVQLADSNFIAVGQDWSTKSVLIIKTDISGNVTWKKTFVPTGASSGRACANWVEAKDGGGFVIAGYTGATNNKDVLLAEFDADGNNTWQKTFGGDGHDIGMRLSIEPTGFLIYASTESFGAIGSYWYIIQTNSSGEQDWRKILCCGGLSGLSFIKTSDMGYISADIISDTTYLCRMNSSFGTTWQRKFRTNSVAVSQTGTDGYALLTVNSLLKTDSDGFEEWQVSVGTDNKVGLITMDGGYLIAGHMDNGTKSYVSKITPFTLISIEKRKRFTQDRPGRQFNIRVYPGRVVCSISAESPELVSLAVHDVSGRRVAFLKPSYSIEGYQTLSWNYTNAKNARVAPGMYVLTMKNGNSSFSKPLVVHP